MVPVSVVSVIATVCGCLLSKVTMGSSVTSSSIGDGRFLTVTKNFSFGWNQPVYGGTGQEDNTSAQLTNPLREKTLGRPGGGKHSNSLCPASAKKVLPRYLARNDQRRLDTVRLAQSDISAQEALRSVLALAEGLSVLAVIGLRQVTWKHNHRAEVSRVLAADAARNRETLPTNSRQRPCGVNDVVLLR